MPNYIKSNKPDIVGRRQLIIERLETLNWWFFMNLHRKWDGKTVAAFRRRLLRWYESHRRVLPWRDHPTPYRVWISEIMLQQTQVKTVIPYYDRFLKRFPDLQSLAEAGEQEVLRLWAGLGYYRRTRDLHRAARLMIEKYGDFPKEYKDILALPGIGKYTAGAICSLAFNQPRPVVDGNIQRVLTRLRAITKRCPENYFWTTMSAWVPKEKPSAFNQAMMELGATICVPGQPRCPECPVALFCKARDLGIQNRIPVARNKTATKRIRLAILLLEYKGKLLISGIHRPSFIPGAWGLPCRQVPEGESPKEAAMGLCRTILGRKILLAPMQEIRHSITSHGITAYGFRGELTIPGKKLEGKSVYRWAGIRQLRDLVTSSLFRKAALKLPWLG